MPLGEDISSRTQRLFHTFRTCSFINTSGIICGNQLALPCVGKRREFLSLCKVMHQTQILPILSLWMEQRWNWSGTSEFSNHIGSPLVESLIFVHNVLVGFNLRDEIKVIVSGKITSGFGMVKRFRSCADLCYPPGP